MRKWGARVVVGQKSGSESSLHENEEQNRLHKCGVKIVA